MIYKDKNYFITGVTSGIGLETAKLLIAQGANIYSIVRNKQAISNIKINAIELNLQEVESIEEKIETLIVGLKLDGIVLCAGNEVTIPFRLTRYNKVLEIFNINFFSNYEILRVLHKRKYLHDSSSIILVSSIMSEFGSPGKTAYSASKAAINGLIKSLSLELSDRKIRVNCISPGMTNTRMGRNLIKNLSDDNLNFLEKAHPLGFAEPQDIAEFLIFLLSGKCSNITGQIIRVDGGYSAQ